MQNAMRRKKQQLPIAECLNILSDCTYGVLALSYDDEPYAVPLNYIFIKSDREDSIGDIYFHCALEGLKTDILHKNDIASFCVVSESEVDPDTFSTAYKSVIAFGKISFLKGEDSYRELYALGDRFNPGAHDAIEKEIAIFASKCYVLKMSIDQLTGKQARSFLTAECS